MSIWDELEALRDRGAGRPASDDVARLYQQAFRDFGPQYLWSRTPSAWPTFTQALTIGESLRREGSLAARALAAAIEQAVRAALRSAKPNPDLARRSSQPGERCGWSDGARPRRSSFSGDIDIFHDREESVAVAAAEDASVLSQAGLQVNWLRREPGFHAATIKSDAETTRLEWARDSDFRFFPTMPDPVFGYVLHAVDIATNKALAAAGRREPRDILDPLFIHDRHLPLGAFIWAAVGKDAGFSPENLIAEIRRNARYRADDYADLTSSEPVDGVAVARRFKAVLADADTFVRAMPIGNEGLLFVQAGRPVQLDPLSLDRYADHQGRREGHWPSSAEIGNAMLERNPGSKS